jgi:hypothetical protein
MGIAYTVSPDLADLIVVPPQSSVATLSSSRLDLD